MVRERQKWAAAFHLICLLLAAGHTHGDHAHRTGSESEPTGATAHRQERSIHPDPLPYDPEMDMTSVEIIRHRGYPVEVHDVITEDGYILQLHRIPHGRKRKPPGRPVFLQHGVLNTAAVWVLNPTEKSLAFLLADRGYDVWLGNARGNTYSRRHVNLDADDKEFWDFTWDHLGYFDIPACIDYVLKATKQSKLFYIGHSLGTAMFFIAASLRPEINDKVHLMVALSPISSVAHSTTPTKLTAPLVRPITFFFELFRVGPVLDTDATMHKIRDLFCHKSTKKASSCRDLIFKFIGANPNNFDLNMLPVINSHALEGTSAKVMAQFAHNFNAGETFIPYDYGHKGNLKRYGQPDPPPYDLSLVTAPVYAYYGRNDPISTPQDALWLAERLGNLQVLYEVGDPLFNHWDFLWASHVHQILYSHVIHLLDTH